MTKKIRKLELGRETVRRLSGGAWDAQAWTAPFCTTNAYSYCTPCAESVNTCDA